MIDCGSCGSQNPENVSFCHACGTRLGHAGAAGALGSAVQDLLAARLDAPEPIARAPVGLPMRPEPAATFRLVSLNDDGSDDRAYPLPEGPIELGRATDDLDFDDPFLATRHARIVGGAGHHVLTALEPLNGVYRRLRGPAELVGGDKLLLGQQLLLFELLPEEERKVVLGIERGIVVFGSRVRPAWGRLLQLTPAGVPRDVYHCSREEIVVGRERTDVVFTDDAILSPRHAKLTLQGGRVFVEDLASDNGTFVSLRAPYVLVAGDIIRLGNQVFRFERVPT